MSDPGSFLSRWLRRKREAIEATDETKSPATSEQAAENARGAEAAQNDRPATLGDAPAPPAPAFDPASLPAIESITADTDIRAFLAPGVPAELTRAALRRVWAADPNIRNFVGLADYDWDFNAPGSMAGFGPLEMTEELRQAVARIIGPPPTEGEIAKSGPVSAEVRPGQDFDETFPGGRNPPREQNNEKIAVAQDAPEKKPDQSSGCDESTPAQQRDHAVQHQSEKPQLLQSVVKSSHGRALPK
jgi:Protein of unknown function (DUF3306)